MLSLTLLLWVWSISGCRAAVAVILGSLSCHQPVLALAYGDNLVFGLGSLLWVLLPSCSPRQLAVLLLLLLLLLWVSPDALTALWASPVFCIISEGIPTFTDILYTICHGLCTIL